MKEQINIVLKYFTKTYFALLLLFSCIEHSYAQFQNHGPQVFAQAVQASHFVKDKAGKEFLFTVVRGMPARLLGYDIQSGAKVLDTDLVGTDGSWDMTLATDNILYIAGNGKIYAFDVEDNTLKDLGKVLPNQNVVWDVHPGIDGEIYGGTYPDALVFKYGPNDGFTEVSNGPIYTGEKYTRSLIFNKKDKHIYAGTGSNAKFVKLNPASQEKARLLIDEEDLEEFVYDLEIVYDVNGDDLIFGFINSNKTIKSFVYSIQKDQIVLKLPAIDIKSIVKAPHTNKVYYTARSRVFELDFEDSNLEPVELVKIKGVGKAGEWVGPGKYRVFTNSKNIYLVDVDQRTAAVKELDVPNSPILIQSIFWGPDDKIWSAGYLAGQHGTFDPYTHEHKEYPGLHQTEGMIAMDGKMYFGIYTKARMYSYDVNKPWEIGKDNPKFIGEISGQDRPFALAIREKNKEVLFGTVPPYGKLGGAIAHLNAINDSVEIFQNIIHNQSIVSLLNNEGKIIGGTSISGGLGIYPTEKKGKIFEWDPHLKKVLWTDSISDYWSISGLFRGPNGNVWGFADGTLFEYDIDRREVLYTLKVYEYAKYPSHIWRNGMGVYHPNGLIYFTLADRLYSFDAVAKKLEKIRDNASLILLGKDEKIYFRNGTDLWSYDPGMRVN